MSTSEAAVPQASAETAAEAADVKPAGSTGVQVPPGEAAQEPSSELTADEKYDLVRSIGEECIQEDELRRLLANKPNPIAYDGFEPSGRMHIAQSEVEIINAVLLQGVMKVINVNKLTKAGCIFKFWVADWYALLNNKMGGDLKKINEVGKYMVEVWKALGMDTTKVEFILTSEEINKRSDEYWRMVMDIAMKNNVKRIIRCSTIMGRSETDDMSAAQIFYPCMQCADIFFLKADICQLGMDQRKVNMLAREYCDQTKRKLKPIILSHRMMPGLLQGQAKMSKSDPDSAIFMDDPEAEVNRKVKKAYCPPNVVEDNPCIEYVKHIIFPWFNKFEVTRDEKDGGNKVYTSLDELCKDYEAGDLHPGDLKPSLTKHLNQILQPVRDHFQNDAAAKALLSKIKKYKITR